MLSSNMKQNGLKTQLKKRDYSEYNADLLKKANQPAP